MFNTPEMKQLYRKARAERLGYDISTTVYYLRSIVKAKREILQSLHSKIEESINQGLSNTTGTIKSVSFVDYRVKTFDDMIHQNIKKTLDNKYKFGDSFGLEICYPYESERRTDLRRLAVKYNFDIEQYFGLD